VFCDIAVLLTADSEAKEAALLILTLNFSPIFVGVELILGGLIPIFLLLFPPTGKRVLSVSLAAFLTMVGIMAMRYVMVIGGQSVPLS
jgi:molybdopterin-containing oxidoreductase family membrane subunit